MRKKIIFSVVVMLMFSSLSLMTGNATAALQRDDMAWTIGDEWELRYTTSSANLTMIFTMKATVTGESQFEIDGVTYDAYMCALTGNLESVNMPLVLNLSLAEGSIITGTLYVSKENDEITKTTQNMDYGLMEETTDKFLNFTQTVITITQVISGQAPETIDVDTNWVETIESDTTTTTTISGSFYDAFIQPGYTNTTTTNSTTTNTYNYECTSQKSITTAAGTFQTYEIRRNIVGEQGYLLQYPAAEVKSDVKEVQYDNNGNIISLIELISYDVASNSSTTTKTPGFELVIVVCSIAMILLWKRKRIS
jgi:hypothetical protein